jgi:hypothetical protein
MPKPKDSRPTRQRLTLVGPTADQDEVQPKPAVYSYACLSAEERGEVGAEPINVADDAA